jgi:hypothetical protein
MCLALESQTIASENCKVGASAKCSSFVVVLGGKLGPVPNLQAMRHRAVRISTSIEVD